jgi:hypothetical protein
MVSNDNVSAGQVKDKGWCRVAWYSKDSSSDRVDVHCCAVLDESGTVDEPVHCSNYP